MSELLGVKLSLGVAGMGGEPEPWVCSGHRCKLEGTCASGWVGIYASLVPVGVPVTLDAGTVCSGHQLRLERIHATVWVGVAGSLDPTGPSYFQCRGFEVDVVGSSPMIMGM